MAIKIFKGQVFYFVKNPKEAANADESYCYFENGALVVENNKIMNSGNFNEIDLVYKNAEIIDFGNCLIMPGFIDLHVHCPQTEIIASYGKQLIEWLENYTYPAEMEFSSKEYSDRVSKMFLSELIKNGTTSCMAYSTIFKESVDSLFEQARKINMRMITGKTLMGRNAPLPLQDSLQNAYSESIELIEKWHNNGRCAYSITPRFAISCPMEFLKMAKKLNEKYPDTFIQTHLSENTDEINFTMKLFPECTDYLNIYESAGIVTERTIFAHCIHLSDSELMRLSKEKAIIAHCPTSNMFLGSGLFNMKKVNNAGINNVIATDVGGGTTFSLLKTLNEAYKIQQLNSYSMDVFESFYKITLGAAKALKLEHEIGSFNNGCIADFVIINPAKLDVQKNRMEYLKKLNLWNIENMLFGLQILGDDRNIVQVFIDGKEINL